MAIPITYADRVDATTPLGTTSEFGATEANEIKTKYNQLVTEFNALSQQLTPLPVAVATADPNTITFDASLGLRWVITIADAGDPLPINEDTYDLASPTKITAGEEMLLLFINENALNALTVQFSSDWKTSDGTTDLANKILPAGGSLVVRVLAISDTKVREIA